MKRLLSLLLALALVFSLAGCFAKSTAPAGDTQLAATDPLGTTLPETTQAPTEQEETQPPEETQPLSTLPPQTDPPQTDPPRQETLPPQTDPDYPDPDEQETLPPQTDPDYPDPDEQETLPPQTDPPTTQPPQTDPAPYLDPNGSYTTKNDVALYIHLYGRLPNNFITKNQAEDRYGWEGGSLSRYGMCIGGDRFYNREGQLPTGYTYYECDIDTLYSSNRGAKRLVFTYSGIIYYTSDHYQTFTRLY